MVEQSKERVELLAGRQTGEAQRDDEPEVQENAGLNRI